MKAYKGFESDMTCRGFQFKEGETYHEDEAKLCESGFHACENPLDCFKYYRPGKSVFHEVELDDVGNETSSDSKICAKTIKIGAELDVLGICKAHFEYIKSKAKKEEHAQNYSSLAARNDSSLAAQNCSSLAAQDYSSLAAQNYSSLAAQDYSSLAAQDYSSLSAGKNSVIAAFNSKVKGDIGTLIALANKEYKNGKWIITDFKAGIVDGEKIKANVWYKLEGGELVECKEEIKRSGKR